MQNFFAILLSNLIKIRQIIKKNDIIAWFLILYYLFKKYVYNEINITNLYQNLNIKIYQDKEHGIIQVNNIILK